MGIFGSLFGRKGNRAELAAPKAKIARVNEHYNLGDFLQAALGLLQQGRMEEAEGFCRGVLRIDPQNADAHVLLGVVLQAEGRLQEAEAAYREALRINPHADAHYNLGYLLQGQSRLQEAEAAYREALRINPQRADAHALLGVVLEDQGRLQEAEAAYREALRIDPQNADMHSLLGDFMGLQGRWQEAEAAYREALRINPQDAARHNLLGDVLREQGRMEEAEAVCREALRINPQHKQALADLAVVWNRRPHYKAAKQGGALAETKLEGSVRVVEDQNGLRLEVHICNLGSETEGFERLKLHLGNNRSRSDSTSTLEFEHSGLYPIPPGSSQLFLLTVESARQAYLSRQLLVRDRTLLLDVHLHGGRIIRLDVPGMREALEAIIEKQASQWRRLGLKQNIGVPQRKSSKSEPRM
jgi:tetratricopeptide (TPR) repeat protein